MPPVIRMALASLVAAATLQASPSDRLSRFMPASLFDTATRARLDGGAAIVDVLPARDRDLAVFGAARTHADAERLVAWMRRIDDFQQGKYVPRIVRFSDPPRLSDLDTLALGAGDIEDLRRCRPGDCGLKLSAAEIVHLRQVISTAGKKRVAAVQVAFRELMLARASTYLAAGHEGTPAAADRGTADSPAAEFAAVAANIGFDAVHANLTSYLLHYPRLAHADAESFLYWSQEDFGTGKPIIGITHVVIVRSGEPDRPDVVVASKQVFATHYLTASLSIAAIAGTPADTGRYLLYLRRSRADLLEGPLGGVVRRIVERRIRSEAPAFLERMRIRLESGEPGIEVDP